MEEAEWSIEVMKELKVPIACTMRICPAGDHDGVSPQDCAVRMAKAGKLQIQIQNLSPNHFIRISCFFLPVIFQNLIHT